MDQPLTATARPKIGQILPWALLLIVAALVPVTLNWFVNPPTREIETVQRADAVVLFAGSSERLDTAVELMERGAAPNLVLPNGNNIDDAEDLCVEAAPFEVFCPDTDPISTLGEARAIGALAEERGWSRLIAVTSVYHVHRATFLLRKCHDGPVEAVASSRDVDLVEWIGILGHEWAGFLSAFILHPTC